MTDPARPCGGAPGRRDAERPEPLSRQTGKQPEAAYDGWRVLNVQPTTSWDVARSSATGADGRGRGAEHRSGGCAADVTGHMNRRYVPLRERA